ncbi:hypothetical protein IH785_16605, partial [candidate division KSB1 bacterium]|nr:hypothetical protein [candidate division KSB1 bacterium]
MVQVYGLMLLAIWMITAGCGYSNAEHRNDQDAVDPEKNADADNEADTPDGVPVEVAIVGTGTISSFLLLSSTVQTEQVVD